MEAERCEPVDVNARVGELLRQWYLYPDQLTDVAPADYAHPQDYLRAALQNVNLLPGGSSRVPDEFSGIPPLERFRALLAGTREGFGFRLSLVSDPEERKLMVSDVYGQYPDEPPSPASEAGMARGWQILAVNDVSVADLFGAQEMDTAWDRLNEQLNEEEVSFEILDLDDNLISDLVLRRAPVQTRSVAISRILEANGHKVGYVHLRDLIATAAFEQLRSTFAEFEAEGARHLILDLRYNGGGDVRALEYLGNLIAGRDAEGALFFRHVYNAKQQAQNREYVFAADPICPESANCAEQGVSLSNVEQVIVLVTGATASAAEGIISGLQPHLPVSVIGSPTRGKPVGSHLFALCNWAFMPIMFRVETAAGPSSYFDGISPTCAVEDDLTRPFGDSEEAMLAAALHWLETGACPESLSAPQFRSTFAQPQRFLDAFGGLLER